MSIRLHLNTGLITYTLQHIKYRLPLIELHLRRIQDPAVRRHKFCLGLFQIIPVIQDRRTLDRESTGHGCI